MIIFGVKKKLGKGEGGAFRKFAFADTRRKRPKGESKYKNRSIGSKGMGDFRAEKKRQPNVTSVKKN